MFRDRSDAGKQLAERLAQYQKTPVVVLALPRGGVVVGAIVARTLGAPLDIVVPRKIGAPGNPEYAIGALTETGETIFNEAERSRVPSDWLEREIEKERREALRRLQAYRGNRLPVPLAGKTVIIIDDGIATGLTMRAAVSSVRRSDPAHIVVAVPVAARDTLSRVMKEADEVVVLEEPATFDAVGSFYESFPQVEDREVITLLRHE